MKKFWKKKWFWFSLLLIVGLGIFLYFWLQKPEVLKKFLPEEVIPEELKWDKFEPASQIKKPVSGSWQNRDFYIETLDEDLESGINPASCQYKVLSYDSEGIEYSSGWRSRKCNFLDWITLGPEKWCRFEGEKACWVFITSQDRAGNQHLPAQAKGSVKYYHIDWTPPQVSQVFIEEGKAKAEVFDNLKITACSLYFDDKNLGLMSFLVPGCQKECLAEKEIDLKLAPGEHRLLAACRDAARNYSWGEELLLKENQPPKISSCRVSPVQGEILTDFQFFIEASDPDADSLSYFWEFGDGESSDKENPVHQYLKNGTFEPKVKVFDGRGGQDSCSTAWVIVGD